MPDKVDALAERKRQLIARSEMYRQSMEADCRHIKEATAWVPRALHLARTVYPILLLAIPLVGWAVSKKKGVLGKRPAPGKGLLGKAATGVKIFRTVKPFWDSLQHSRRTR